MSAGQLKCSICGRSIHLVRVQAPNAAPATTQDDGTCSFCAQLKERYVAGNDTRRRLLLVTDFEDRPCERVTIIHHSLS